MDIPVGYLVGDAQCTLGIGPWSSTGPGSWFGDDVPVVVQRQVLWPPLLANGGSTVDTCSARLYLVGYGRISHIFYVLAVLRP